MWETSTKRLQRHVERSRKRFKPSDEQVMDVEYLLSLLYSYISLIARLKIRSICFCCCCIQ